MDGAGLWYVRDVKVYTFKQVAVILGLKTSSGVSRRLLSLDRRGIGLSQGKGEIVVYGGRRVLTDKGVERIERFVGGKVGRKRREYER